MGKRGVIRPLLNSWRRHLTSAGRAPATAAAARPASFETLETRELLSAAAAPVVDAVWDGRHVRVVQGEYLVEFKAHVKVGKLAGQSGFTDVARVGSTKFYSLSADKSIKQMEAWAANHADTVIDLSPNVVTRVADISLPNDPFVGDQWQYHNTGQTVPDPTFDPTGDNGYFFGTQAGTPGADIDAADAWSIVQGDPNRSADPATDAARDRSKDIVVAVLDTGIDLNHPDLVNNIWSNPNEIPGNGIDDDGDGFVDDVHGWNFVAGTNDVTDDFGHGTHVSGIIGAQGNNNVGVTGVIQHVTLLPVKIGDRFGTLTTVDIINGINYVTTLKNQGVDIVVANGSFGGTTFPFNRVLNDAVARMGAAGTLFTVAAGNDAANVDPGQDFPGKFSLNQPNVITVAATDNQDNIAFFSNIGAATVQIAAPGLNILSTLPTYDVGTLLETGDIVPSNTLNYGYDSGTSMAAPMVAGALALMKAAKPDASMMDLKNALLTGADHIPALDKPVSAGSPLVSTAGRLNVNKAILNLLNQRTNVDTDTRGSWVGAYGKQGAVVYGASGSVNEFSNSFVTARVSGASLNVISDTTSDPDALQSTFNHANRVASQLTSAGPITLDLEFTGGLAHRVSLYQAALNDRRAGRQTISLVDPDTGATLATYSTGNLATGEYQTFLVSPPAGSAGPYRLRVVITPNGKRNAVLNGLFFDPAPTGSAARVTPSSVAGVNPVTGGDWRQNFGSQGAKIFGSTTNINAKVTVKHGAQVVKPQFRNADAALVQTRATSDSQRVAAYVQAKRHMDIRVTVGDTPKKLTVYAADLEKQGRAERLDLYDANTGALLDSTDLTNFAAGQYVSWVVSGKVRLRVTRLAGPNAVIGGVFLDAAPSAQLSYVGIDPVTSGNWTNFYGANANFVFGSDQAPVRRSTYSAQLDYGAANPASGAKSQFVTLTLRNAGNNTPARLTTTDSRYPLLPGNNFGLRANNPKATGNSMILNLNFTDQRTHTVALYMVDPDTSNSRAQRVDLQLINPVTGQPYTVASQIVSSFSKGKYLVFNVNGSNSAAQQPDARIRISRVAGATAVVNGLFVG